MAKKDNEEIPFTAGPGSETSEKFESVASCNG